MLVFQYKTYKVKPLPNYSKCTVEIFLMREYQIKKSEYFSKTKNGYMLDKKIRRTVKFYRGNLVKISPPLTYSKYNVIFCRNLLIYFDNSFQKQAISTLDNLLCPNGLLFIGHAEPGIFSGSQFISAPYPKSFSFHRRTEEEISTEEKFVSFAVQPEPEVQPFQSIQIRSDESQKIEDNNILRDTDFEEARFAADRGDYDTAINLCENVINDVGPSASIFMLLGMIYDEKKNYSLAIKSLKKAIYLYPEYIEALDLLATVYNRYGDKENYNTYNKRLLRVKDRLNRKAS